MKFTKNNPQIVTFTCDKNNNIIKRYYDFEHYFSAQETKRTHTTLFGDKVTKYSIEKIGKK